MNNSKFNQTLKTAKAIYLVSGLRDVVIYLDAKEELGDISFRENNVILDRVSVAYANTTVGELDKIRNMF